MKILCERSALIKEMAPKELRMIHGDLHFQNILIDLSKKPSFILADPRGEAKVSDIYYDLGKLWHSCNALYDFIHTDMFEIIVNENEIKFSIFNKKQQSIYKNILDFLKVELPKYEQIKNDPLWEKKVLFSEAMHLASVMPFHLKNDGKEERAILLFVRGVLLLNKFIDKYEIEKIPPDNQLLNVNFMNDYIKAKRIQN